MRNLAYICTKAAVWLLRIRKRKGYGVHSPFAYEYIRQVIYGHMDKKVARSLRLRQRAESRKMGRPWAQTEHRPEKELLYRMACRTQPELIVCIGRPTAAALYLGRACPDAYICHASQRGELSALDTNACIDFAYINICDQPAVAREAFERCASQAGAHSVCTIHGIHHSKEMRAAWEEMKEHCASGITFDLYDLGIVMFDKRLNKQDYIINF